MVNNKHTNNNIKQVAKQEKARRIAIVKSVFAGVVVGVGSYFGVKTFLNRDTLIETQLYHSVAEESKHKLINKCIYAWTKSVSLLTGAIGGLTVFNVLYPNQTGVASAKTIEPVTHSALVLSAKKKAEQKIYPDVPSVPKVEMQ